MNHQDHELAGKHISISPTDGSSRQENSEANLSVSEFQSSARNNYLLEQKAQVAQRTPAWKALVLAAASAFVGPDLEAQQAPQGDRTPAVAKLSLGDRFASIGEAQISIRVNGETRVIPIIRDQKDPTKPVTYRPFPFFHFKTNPETNSIIWDLDQTSDSGGQWLIGVKIAWATPELIELTRHIALEKDTLFLEQQNVDPASVKAEALQLQDLIIQASHKRTKQTYGEGREGEIYQVDPCEGVLCYIEVSPAIGAQILSSSGGNVQYSPYFTPIGVKTAEVRQQIEGLQEITSRVMNSLSNEQRTGNSPILQQDLHRINQELIANLRSSTVITSQDAIPLVSRMADECMMQLFRTGTVTGEDAAAIARTPAYEQMMSTWLAALQQETGFTDQQIKMVKTSDGTVGIEIDRDSIMKGIENSESDGFLWGIFGSDRNTTMNGSERTHEVIDKIMKMCETQTGTTFQKRGTDRFYKPHSIKVARSIEGQSSTSLNSVNLVSLSTGEHQSLLKTRPIDCNLTEKAISNVIAKLLKESNEKRAAAKKSAEEKQADELAREQQRAREKEAAEREAKFETRLQEYFKEVSNVLQKQREARDLERQARPLENEKRRLIDVLRMNQGVRVTECGTTTMLERMRGSNPILEVELISEADRIILRDTKRPIETREAELDRREARSREYEKDLEIFIVRQKEILQNAPKEIEDLKGRMEFQRGIKMLGDSFRFMTDPRNHRPLKKFEIR